MKPWAREQIERGLGADPARTREVGRASNAQRTAHGKLRSRCHDCREIIVGETAATRHMKETGHHRFEVLL